MLGAATCVEDILATLEAGKPPGIVAIDSIQTLWTGALDAAPGTIAQVRTAPVSIWCAMPRRPARRCCWSAMLTKDGQIAGPKAVEHLVDAVLYFEGERGHHFRVLRAVKNRFGATDEIGVFEMTGKGLAEVANPSALFLGDRKQAVARHRGVRRAGRHAACCSARFRRWCRPPLTARRAAPWWAGTPAGWR